MPTHTPPPRRPLAGVLAVLLAAATFATEGAIAVSASSDDGHARTLQAGAVALLAGAALSGGAALRARRHRLIVTAAGVYCAGAFVVWLCAAALLATKPGPYDPDRRPAQLVIERGQWGAR